MLRFITAVADERGLIEPFAAFTLEVLTYLIAFMTAAALAVTDEELIAYIGLSAVETLHAEVLGIIEGTLVPSIHRTMQPDLLYLKMGG